YFCGLQLQEGFASPEYGALAFLIDDDVGGLGSTTAGDEVRDVHAGDCEARALDSGECIAPDGAHVLGSQAELGAGSHRGRHLAAGGLDLAMEALFAG